MRIENYKTIKDLKLFSNIGKLITIYKDTVVPVSVGLGENPYIIWRNEKIELSYPFEFNTSFKPAEKEFTPTHVVIAKKVIVDQSGSGRKFERYQLIKVEGDIILSPVFFEAPVKINSKWLWDNTIPIEEFKQAGYCYAREDIWLHDTNQEKVQINRDDQYIYSPLPGDRTVWIIAGTHKIKISTSYFNRKFKLAPLLGFPKDKMILINNAQHSNNSEEKMEKKKPKEPEIFKLKVKEDLKVTTVFGRNITLYKGALVVAHRDPADGYWIVSLPDGGPKVKFTSKGILDHFVPVPDSPSKPKFEFYFDLELRRIEVPGLGKRKRWVSTAFIVILEDLTRKTVSGISILNPLDSFVLERAFRNSISSALSSEGSGTRKLVWEAFLSVEPDLRKKYGLKFRMAINKSSFGKGGTRLGNS